MRRTLRLYLYHRHDPGRHAGGNAAAGGGDAPAAAAAASAASAGAAEPPSWSFTIAGRLLLKKEDPGLAAAAAGGDEGPAVPRHPLTHYLRSVEVRRLGRPRPPAAVRPSLSQLLGADQPPTSHNMPAPSLP